MHPHLKVKSKLHSASPTRSMPADHFAQLLDRAAAQFGIEPGFWDIWGKYHETSMRAKQAILGALGVTAGSAEELEATLAARSRRDWERLAPPVVVEGEHDRVEIELNVAAERLGERAHFEVRRED